MDDFYLQIPSSHFTYVFDVYWVYMHTSSYAFIHVYEKIQSFSLSSLYK